MDFRYLIIQSIALLFWESQVPEEGFDSKPLIRELINNLPNPDTLPGTDDDRENFHSLKEICGSMILRKQEEITREFLASKLRLGIKKDNELREDIQTTLGSELDSKEKILERIKLLRQELNTYFYQKKFKDEMTKFAKKTIFSGAGYFSVPEMAREMCAVFDQYTHASFNDEEDPNLNGKGSTDDREALANSLMEVKEELDPASRILTGWQAFNRMCGEAGGLIRGNMYLIGARPSNGKSLITSCLTLHSMILNKPYLFDQNKKPCVIHISMENHISLNFKIWFRYLWENEYNETPNLLEMTPKAMADWFIERIQQNGFTFKWFHFNPNTMGYEDVLKYLRQVEQEGYEISLCTIDYLAMISNAGLGEENRAFWLRQLFKVVRNYTAPRKITTLIPHQVAVDSANLLRAGTDDFVRQIAGKRYWSECKSIDMEVDMEVVLNIEHTGQGADRQSYMAFGRGKDRSSSGTPEKDCFFFIPFSKTGGLRWDLNGKDSSRASLRGAGSITVNDEDWLKGGEDDEF